MLGKLKPQSQKILQAKIPVLKYKPIKGQLAQL